MNRFLTFVVVLTLAACSRSPDLAGPSPDPTPPGEEVISTESALSTPERRAPHEGSVQSDEDSCNKAAYVSIIGKSEKDPMVPPASALVRHIHPGDQVTMDYRSDRLDIDIDDKGVITGLRCG
ncbi:MAG: hypothetical protein GC155_03750 [Alphaproteobacteria bacterium]|nr:hypothetical protein [Alphaproteobacteria bacterium]